MLHYSQFNVLLVCYYLMILNAVSSYDSEFHHSWCLLKRALISGLVLVKQLIRKNSICPKLPGPNLKTIP